MNGLSGDVMLRIGPCLVAALLALTVPAAAGDSARKLASAAADDRRAAQSAELSSKIPMHLTGGLSGYERAKILLAVNDWNFALNGPVRFELLENPTAASDPSVWIIAADRSPPSTRASNSGFAIAHTMRLNAGGIVIVHVAELANRDLAGVMRHELGHVLGLDHQPGGVMDATYTAHGMACVDRASAERVRARLAVDGPSARGC
jgi:hypothetical protein